MVYIPFDVPPGQAFNEEFILQRLRNIRQNRQGASHEGIHSNQVQDQSPTSVEQISLPNESIPQQPALISREDQRVSDNQDEIKLLREQLSHLSQSQKDLSDTIGKLEAENTAHKSRYDNLEKSHTELCTKVDTLTQMQLEAESRAARYRGALEQADKLIKLLSGMVPRQENELQRTQQMPEQERTPAREATPDPQPEPEVHAAPVSSGGVRGSRGQTRQRQEGRSAATGPEIRIVERISLNDTDRYSDEEEEEEDVDPEELDLDGESMQRLLSRRRQQPAHVPSPQRKTGGRPKKKVETQPRPNRPATINLSALVAKSRGHVR